MLNDQTIVVCSGVICKWGDIKHLVDEADVRKADGKEYREYYLKKIQ